MNAYPKSLKNVINLLKNMPGLGEKSATRLAFYLLNMSDEDVKNFCDTILNMKRSVSSCKECFHLSDGDLCSICSDPSRNSYQICVVETTSDVISIEEAGVFNGKYHVLGGTINPVEDTEISDLKIEELIKRIDRHQIKEVIIATNPTPQGEATAHYLFQILKDKGIEITRIALGIPMGGDIKYVDPMTIKLALEGRRKFSEE